MPKKRNRPATNFDLERVTGALELLRRARTRLHQAGAHHAGYSASRAIKSADGARRHLLGALARPAVVRGRFGRQRLTGGELAEFLRGSRPRRSR